MTKDIDVRVNTQIEQASRNLDAFEQKVRQTGKGVEGANQQAGDSTEKVTQKFGGLGSIIDRVKTQAMAMISGFLGLHVVVNLVTSLIEKLEKVKDLQDNILGRSISVLELAQGLEFQTGTSGQQRFWARAIVDLQEAGGLKDSATSAQALTSADVALKSFTNEEGVGGIRNAEVMDMLKEVAPFLGMAQYGEGDIAATFSLAKNIGVEANPEAYKRFFAQLQAAYTQSSSTSIGPFITGLTRASTAYMAGGGSFEEAAGLYAGAVQVLGYGGEAEGATLVRQIGLISAGTNENARQAIERSQGVQWGNLTGDQRLQALLGHVNSLPESQRQAILAQQGFAPEIAQNISMFAQDNVAAVMADTTAYVTNATAESGADAAEEYLASDLGRYRQMQARNAARDLRQTSATNTQSMNRQEAQREYETQVATGEMSPATTDSAGTRQGISAVLISELERMGTLEGEFEAERQALIQEIRASQEEVNYVRGNPLGALNPLRRRRALLEGTNQLNRRMSRAILDLQTRVEAAQDAESQLAAMNAGVENESAVPGSASLRVENAGSGGGQAVINNTNITYSNDVHYYPQGNNYDPAAVAGPENFR